MFGFLFRYLYEDSRQITDNFSVIEEDPDRTDQLSSGPMITSFAWLKVCLLCAAILLLMFVHSNIIRAQNAPPSPERQWLGPGEQQIKRDAERFQDSNLSIDGAKIYSLAELIDFAQSHNPETRFAWERARAQGAALGVARSELYPTLAAVALSVTKRDDILADSTFVRQTIESLRVAFDLSYTVFDFGGRAGRIDAA
jgi:hypothetical protein